MPAVKSVTNTAVFAVNPFLHQDGMRPASKIHTKALANGSLPLAPRSLQKRDPVAVHDAGNVAPAIAALGQQVWNLGKIGNGVQVGWTLFAAEAAIQIGADAAVRGVAG